MDTIKPNKKIERLEFLERKIHILTKIIAYKSKAVGEYEENLGHDKELLAYLKMELQAQVDEKFETEYKFHSKSNFKYEMKKLHKLMEEYNEVQK